jgi:hypothetical protein
MTLSDIMDQKILELTVLESDPYADLMEYRLNEVRKAIEILAKQIMKENGTDTEPDHKETPTIELYPGSKPWNAVHG